MTVSTPAPPDLLSPEHIADPWAGFATLRDHYPVYFDEAMETWLISRYDDIRQVLRAHEPGAAAQELLGQYFADTLFFGCMEGQDHRRVRSLLAPVFSRGGVESFHAHFERQARELLDPIFERERKAVAAGERERPEMDFIKEFTNRFSVMVMMEIMDFRDLDFDRMTAWFNAWISAEGNLTRDPAVIERALWAKEDFGDYILPLIEERRGGDGVDLVSRLCRAEKDGYSLPTVEVQSTIAGMFVGGGETTDHQIGWIMNELATKPDLQREVLENRDLLGNLLAESMRYHAIVQYLSRAPLTDLQFGDVTIEAGAPVVLVLAAGNRDPRRFADPDEFDIHRSDLDAAKAFTGAADHLGFGSGSHLCIGSHITKAEMEIALSVFFEQASDVRLADGQEPQADPEAMFIRTLTNLPITFELS